MTAYERLLSPIKVGGVELRNRIITTAHVAFKVWDGREPVERYVEYQRRRASAGASMVVLEPIWIEPYGDWPAPVADRMATIADAMHEAGTAAVLQLVSYGGQAGLGYLLTGLAGRLLWSFNGMQSPFGPPSHKMTSDEVGCMVDGFARAARVAAEAGLDGVELHGAHGYLIHESFSPWGNGRDDEWGEPLAFAKAVISATRQALGPGKILGFRTALLDDVPPDEGGLSETELIDVATSLVEGGEIDYLNISTGSKAPDYAVHSTASYRYEPGLELGYSAMLRRAVGGSPPVVGVGRILTPGQGEQALADGACDLVAMTRGHIADPEIVTKIHAGATDRIRPCVGANECVDRSIGGMGIACFHNPEVGRERVTLRRSRSERRVLVVGAGPVGLKAGEMAASRGHDVTVVERAAEPGGRLRAVKETEARDLFGAVDWLVRELDHAGAELRLETVADQDLVAALAPDHVVLATGGRPAPHVALPDAPADRVLTSEEALAAPVGARVVVLDRTGTPEAALVAETLAKRGSAATLVTPFELLAPFSGYTIRADLRAALRRVGCDVVVLSDVASVTDEGVTVVDPDGTPVRQLAADHLVAVTVPVPDIGLVPVLGEMKISHHVVGDAVAPRGVLAGMREAASAAAAI